MNAVAATNHGVASGAATVTATAPARLALLGTGTVGCAVLARLTRWSGTRLGDGLSLVYAANSRFAIGAVEGLCMRAAQSPRVFPLERTPFGHLLSYTHTSGAMGEGKSACASDLNTVVEVLGDHATRIVIDATASEAVAARHAEWLAQGIHVVTACKLGQGTSLARWHAIKTA